MMLPPPRHTLNPPLKVLDNIHHIATPTHSGQLAYLMINLIFYSPYRVRLMLVPLEIRSLHRFSPHQVLPVTSPGCFY